MTGGLGGTTDREGGDAMARERDAARGLDALRRLVASVLLAEDPRLAPAGGLPAGMLLTEAATGGRAAPTRGGPGGYDDSQLAASSEED